jgi:ubiquitin C-terminal hydrolase
MTKKKLNSIFDFPFEFDMSPYMVNQNGPKTYELVGIINHSGSVFGDHYISFIRVSGNQWMEFNDSSVSEIKTEDIKKLNGCPMKGGYSFPSTSNAYVLVYRIKPPSKFDFNPSANLISLSLFGLKETDDSHYLELLLSILQTHSKYSSLILKEPKLFFELHLSSQEQNSIFLLQQLFSNSLRNVSQQNKLAFFKESIKLLNVSSFQQSPQNMNEFLKFLLQYLSNLPKEFFTQLLYFFSLIFHLKMFPLLILLIFQLFQLAFLPLSNSHHNPISQIYMIFLPIILL